MNRLIGWVGGLLTVAVGYGLINLLLVGGQSMMHRADRAALDSLKQVLAADSAQLALLERAFYLRVDQLKSLESEIEVLDTWIKGVERRNPRGIPEMIYPQYVSRVARHNELVTEFNLRLDEHKVRSAKYSAGVDRYNSLIDSANVIAERAGTTWYLVPVPHASARRVN